MPLSLEHFDLGSFVLGAYALGVLVIGHEVALWFLTRRKR